MEVELNNLVLLYVLLGDWELFGGTSVFARGRLLLFGKDSCFLFLHPCFFELLDQLFLLSLVFDVSGLDMFLYEALFLLTLLDALLLFGQNRLFRLGGLGSLCRLLVLLFLFLLLKLLIVLAHGVLDLPTLSGKIHREGKEVLSIGQEGEILIHAINQGLQLG